jgi:hypothetical protein
MFEDAINAWKAYCATASWPTDDEVVHGLAAEIRERLGQLDIVLEHVQRACAAFGPPNPPENWLRAGQEVQLFTETFYFVAWRIIAAVRHAPPAMFPPSGANLQAVGVRDVRNRLIEHPEKPGGGIFKQEVVITSDGPVLKPVAIVVRASGRSDPAVEGVDHALYVNAREFHDAFMALVGKFHARLPQRGARGTPRSG